MLLCRRCFSSRDAILTLAVVAASIVSAPPSDAQSPNCSNGVRDGVETDIDCGGASACECLPGTPWWDCYFGGSPGMVCGVLGCGGCEDGKRCRSDRDCLNRVCKAGSDFLCLFGRCGGTCASPTCGDGVRNGDEIGVDSGGACCRNGVRDGDESGVDTGGSCCLDGVQDGDETAVDSGGSCCVNHLQNGDETGVDCGGSCTPCECWQRGTCRIFVTSEAYSGNLGGLEGADARCNARAAAAGLAGVFQAWLCDGFDSPSTRSTKWFVPYVRTDGVLIADDWVDLTSGSIHRPIDRTEFGKLPPYSLIHFMPWTHVAADGTCDDETYLGSAYSPCPTLSWCPLNCAKDPAKPGWNSASKYAQGSKGDIGRFFDDGWTDSVTGLCSTPREPLYCIEQ